METVFPVYQIPPVGPHCYWYPKIRRGRPHQDKQACMGSRYKTIFVFMFYFCLIRHCISSASWAGMGQEQRCWTNDDQQLHPTVMDNRTEIRSATQTTRSSLTTALSDLEGVIHRTITDSKSQSNESTLPSLAAAGIDTDLAASFKDRVIAATNGHKLMAKLLATGTYIKRDDKVFSSLYLPGCTFDTIPVTNSCQYCWISG